MVDLNALYGTVSDGGGGRVFSSPTNANDGNAGSWAGSSDNVRGAHTTTTIFKTVFDIARPASGFFFLGGGGKTDFNWTNSNGRVRSTVFEGSNDGSAWTTIAHSEVWDGTSTTVTFDNPEEWKHWRGVVNETQSSGLLFWGGVGFFTWEIIEGEGPPLPPEDPQIDWDVFEPNPPGDTLTYVGTLNDAYNKVIRPVRNQPGTGQFSINRNSPNATADIIKMGNLVKVKYPQIHSDYLFSWFMEKGDFALVSSDEEGGEEITIGGDGGMKYWDFARWLHGMFVGEWWTCDDDPAAGDIGQVTVAAGTYRVYDVVGGVIDGYTNHTVGSTDCWYYDSRKTYVWPGANPNGTDNQRFLVHLTSGPYAGDYFHPLQAGVTDLKKSYVQGTSILLSTISEDTPGKILYRMFEEAQSTSRPQTPIPLMTIDFTEDEDSNGDPWNTTDALAGVTVELGESYLDTIMKLVATGVIDVEMGPDLLMHAYNAQGRDLTGEFGAGNVRFEKNINIADDLHRERDEAPAATHIEVIGANDVVASAALPDAASRVTRETSMTADSEDVNVLEAMGLAELQSRLVRSDAVVFAIPPGDDDANGLYLPGWDGTDNGDFWLGDLTTLHTGEEDDDFDEADMRVAAITITEDDGGNLVVLPELGSTIGEAERTLFGGAISSRSASTRSGGSTIPPAGDTSVAEDLTASMVAVVDAATLYTATNVEAALAEVVTRHEGHLSDTLDAHDAGAISIVDSDGKYTGTTVEAALQEFPKRTVTTTDPTVNEDSADGYSVESRWINITSAEEFVCLDATVGAAVWSSTTNQGSGSTPSGTTLGDLLVWDGAAWDILPAGTDGDVLTADSGAGLGLDWDAPTGGSTHGFGDKIGVWNSTSTAGGTGAATPITGVATANPVVVMLASEGNGSWNTVTQTGKTFTRIGFTNPGSKRHEVWYGTGTGTGNIVATLAVGAWASLIAFEWLGTALTPTYTLAGTSTAAFGGSTLGSGHKMAVLQTRTNGATALSYSISDDPNARDLSGHNIREHTLLVIPDALANRAFRWQISGSGPSIWIFYLD